MAEAASTTAPLDESLAKILGEGTSGVKSPITYDPGQSFRPGGDIVQVSGEPAIGATVPEVWTHEIQLETMRQNALEFEYQKQQAAIENARLAAQLELSQSASALNQAQFGFQQEQAGVQQAQAAEQMAFQKEQAAFQQAQAEKEYALALEQEQRAAEQFYYNTLQPVQSQQQLLANQADFARVTTPGTGSVSGYAPGVPLYSPVTQAAYNAVGGSAYTGPPLSSGQMDKLAYQSGQVPLSSVNVFKMY